MQKAFCISGSDSLLPATAAQHRLLLFFAPCACMHTGKINAASKMPQNDENVKMTENLGLCCDDRKFNALLPK
jgi:hypothetical protein